MQKIIKTILVVVCLVGLIFGVSKFLIVRNKKVSVFKDINPISTLITPYYADRTTLIPTSVNDETSQLIIDFIKNYIQNQGVWRHTNWNPTISATISYFDKTINGKKKIGYLQTNELPPLHFDSSAINQDGWVEEPTMAAGGIRGEIVGYSRETPLGKRVLQLSLTLQQFNKRDDETGIFICPCTYQYEVFLSEPIKKIKGILKACFLI